MMSRRRLVALLSAAIMLAIGAGAIGAFVVATQSEGGREWIRRVAEAQLERAVQGNVHLGTLSGSFLTDLQVDSVRIADRDDSLFVASGPVRVTFDPRDLADGRIILRTVSVTRPHVAVRREIGGRWTHQKLFPRSTVRRTLRRRTAFGAVFLIEDARIRDGAVTLLLPWAPDSAPRDVVTRAWEWRALQLDVPRARFAYPDSVGTHIRIARLDVDERDPPFAFRELQGELRILRDTLLVDLPHFSLPGSGGRAVGRVTWGRGLPSRYSFRVEADSVALADVAWINPAIPTEGGGRMRLDIRNAGADPKAIEYRITQMDVRSHRSRLRGTMTWGVVDAEVSLRDVDLEMAPLHDELITRFNRGPLPIPLRGQIEGRLRGRGGPLSAFVVEDATATFRDANVPGAVSRARASGTLDLTEPASPVFSGLLVDVASFDLRTARALDPAVPALDGTLEGTARLDSVWGNLRISDADLTHRDGDAPTSRLRGTMLVAWNEGPLRWDVDLAALPLSFTTLARSFPALPLRGEFSGPLRSAGQSGDLTLITDLLGAAGRLDADLRIDPTAPGYIVSGRTNLTNVDPRRLLDDPRAPAGELNGRVVLDAQGDSLANLAGSAQVTLDRSLLDGARIFTGTLRLNFGDGRAVLDTLYLESSAVDLAGRGAIGLRRGVTDTLTVRARMDSLGGLRPWLGRPAGDSLTGAALLDLSASGWVRDFAVDATATAGGLRFAGSTISAVNGTAQLRGLPDALAGVVAVGGDTVNVGGLALASARLDATLHDDETTALALNARGATATRLFATGLLSRREDSLRLRLDTVDLGTSRNAWRLADPAHIAIAQGGFTVDSLELRAAPGAFLTLAGLYPQSEALDLRFRARTVGLADIAELLQLEGAQSGDADVDARLTGTRSAPLLEATGALTGGLVRGIRLDTLRLTARAVADRLDLRAVLGPAARPALAAEAQLPLLLGLDGRGTGMVAGGAVRGRITADSLGLETFESLTRGATGARGTMRVDVALGGTWAHPTTDGAISVRNGFLAPAALGNVRWRGVTAEVGFAGDSVAIRTLSATSGAARTGTASVSGWITLADRQNPRFDLRATSRGFNVLARPDLADVDMSGDLQLSGAWRGATLRGALTADRAIIAIPELATKDVISLAGPDRFGVVDTLAMTDTRVVSVAPPAFVDNLTIAGVPLRMGRDVWIRSSEANINLGGQLNITRGRMTRGPNAGQQQLAVDGPLQTVRGTYRLNLGPVQRTFTVEQGEIRFFGDPELNPTLNINALHTVRQYSQQGVRPDVRVRVHLGGTLRQPTAELSTPDSVRVTNADLISYLVTGGPSYEIGGRDGDISAAAARVVLGSIGSVLGGKASGGLCDEAQVSTAGLEAYQGRLRDVGGGILAGTRFNCAKQVGDRAFVRLDAGLCQVGQLMTQGAGSDPLSFTDALGVKLDYLLGSGYSASVGVEPPTSAVLCAVNANASARGFVPTPRQVGFDLFRVWRF
jgi:translocation and assembly module TamB